jgi:hypothetical protein
MPTYIIRLLMRTNEIFLIQRKYTVDILRIFEILDYKSMTTLMVMDLKKLSETSSDSDLIDPFMYQQLIGSLMYLVNTKHDIFYEVNALIPFMSELRQIHWVDAKHVLRCLRGIIGYGLRHASIFDMRLQGYADLDWVGNTVDMKRTTRCYLNFVSVMVSWCSRKQTSMALSTIETKYIVVCMEVCEAMWLQKLCVVFSDHILDPTMIHYIRDMVHRKIVVVEYLLTNEKIVDVLIDPLSKLNFEYFHDKIGE